MIGRQEESNHLAIDWENAYHFGGIAALNPADLPYEEARGKYVRVSEVVFWYKGPVIELHMGWALKPAGKDFNNGDNLVTPYYSFAALGSTPNCPDWTKITIDFPSGNRIQIPAPGRYTNRHGDIVEFHDLLDTWVWITNFTAMSAAGASGPSGLSDERFILVSDDDDKVVSTGIAQVTSPAVQAMEVRYAIS